MPQQKVKQDWSAGRPCLPVKRPHGREKASDYPKVLVKLTLLRRFSNDALQAGTSRAPVITFY